MDRLRSPGGCPWDAEQTHASLLPYLLEESHEVDRGGRDRRPRRTCARSSATCCCRSSSTPGSREEDPDDAVRRRRGRRRDRRQARAPAPARVRPAGRRPAADARTRSPRTGRSSRRPRSGATAGTRASRSPCRRSPARPRCSAGWLGRDGGLPDRAARRTPPATTRWRSSCSRARRAGPRRRRRRRRRPCGGAHPPHAVPGPRERRPSSRRRGSVRSMADGGARADGRPRAAATRRYRQLATDALDELLETRPGDGDRTGRPPVRRPAAPTSRRRASASPGGMLPTRSARSTASTTSPLDAQRPGGPGDPAHRRSPRGVLRVEELREHDLGPAAREPPGSALYLLLARDIAPSRRTGSRRWPARLAGVPGPPRRSRGRSCDDDAAGARGDGGGAARGAVGAAGEPTSTTLLDAATRRCAARSTPAAAGRGRRARATTPAGSRTALPECDRDPRLGEQRFAAKLWYALDTETRPTQLLARAESDLQAGRGGDRGGRRPGSPARRRGPGRCARCWTRSRPSAPVDDSHDPAAVPRGAVAADGPGSSRATTW